MDIDILLIGKNGNGKSATGNSILGREAFKCSDTGESVTCKVQHEYGRFDGKNIKVVDCPGIKDTDNIKDQEMATLKIIQVMQDAIMKHPDGYHAFILVGKYGGRFTEEDKKVIDLLKQIFGPNVVKDFCILVMTYGDNYISNKANKNKPFKTWCSEQKGALKELMEECCNRVVLFDNNTDDQNVKINQLKTLFQTIHQLQYSRRYTNDHFKESEERRKQLEIQCKEPRITENMRKKCSIILARCKFISQSKDDGNQLTELKSLFIESEDLKKEVLKLDNKTGVLKIAMDLSNQLEGSISQQMLICTINKEKLAMEKDKEQITKDYEKKLKQNKAESNEQCLCLLKQAEDTYKTQMLVLEKRIEEKNNKLIEQREALKNPLSESERKYEELKKDMKTRLEEMERKNKIFEEINPALRKRIMNVFFPSK